MIRWRWLLFAAAVALPSRSAAQPPVSFLYTDWTVVPGRVFYQGSSGERTLLQGSTDRIYSVTVGPDGVTYIVDAKMSS